jgi:hypothetical protein
VPGRVERERYSALQLTRKSTRSRGQFCSDPVLSHAYFPEWKPAFKSYFGLGQVLIVDTAYLHLIKNTDKKSFAYERLETLSCD